MAFVEKLRPQAGTADGRAPVRTGSANMIRRSALRGDQQSDVLLVTHDAELKERLASGFAQKKHFQLRTMKGTAAEVESVLGLDPMPAIVLIDLKTAAAEDLAALDRIKRGKFSKTPVIAISSYLDQDIVRRLVQIKVDDWLPKDSNFIDIYKSCERVHRAPAAEFRGQEAQVYSFFPAAGGSGNTTLAIQTAFLIGRHKRQMESTCLVDLNFQDGSIADYLDIAPSFRIDELANTPGRLDSQLMDVMLSRHASGLAVLATPRMPAKYIEVSEGLIGAVLGMLSRSFDNVIIDLPKNWYPWMDNVIWGSNNVYIVTNFTVPALRHARYVLDAITAKIVNEAKVAVIVNKYHEALFGSGLRKTDAEQLLRDWLAGFIPDSGSLVQEAINRGMPVSEVSPSSKLEKALKRIVIDGTGGGTAGKT
jgi:pilus assembly protein CpaE